MKNFLKDLLLSAVMGLFFGVGILWITNTLHLSPIRPEQRNSFLVCATLFSCGVRTWMAKREAD